MNTIAERQAECAVKLERLQKMMDDRGLMGVYIKRQDNFAWLTCGGVNYIGLGETGNCGLLVLRNGERYAVTNNIEAPRMDDEEHLTELGFPILFSVWHDSGFEKKTVTELCPENLGCDHASALGVNVASAIAPLRYSLTAQEIERYRYAGHLISRAVEQTAASIRPGDREKTIAGRLYALCMQDGLDVTSIMCASDERIYGYRHPIPTEKVVRERVQLGGNIRYRGITICLTRFVTFAPLSDALKAQYKANREIDCTMMANTVPGSSYQRPFLAGKAAYEAHGYGEEFNKHHQGGPIGYVPRDCRVGFENDVTIRENQAFCWNPSITGTKSEDTMIATSQGPQLVTHPVLFPTVKVEAEGLVFERAGVLML